VALALLLGVVGALQVNHLRQRGQQAGQLVKRSGRGRLQRRPVPDDVDESYLNRLEKELSEL